MALIHVYNGFSDENTQHIFNGRLCDNLDIDWSNAVALRGGHKVPPEYAAEENDIIFVRKLPSASVAGTIFMSLWWAGLAGIVGYGIYKTVEAVTDLKEAQKNAATDRSSRLPYVRGAKNQAATGQTIPFVMGETLYTPLRLCPPHYTISGAQGENQYYNVVLECGYNNILFRHLKMGNTIIKTFTESAPQNGIYDWDNGTYFDAENRIEIRQSEEFTTEDFRKKIILTELNKEIPHRHASTGDAEEIKAEWEAGVIQELPTNPMSVELIVLFDGLQKFSNSNWDTFKISLQAQWTNNPDDPEPVWQDFAEKFDQNGTLSNDFTYNTKKQMRFVCRKTFTPEQVLGNKISIRVRRTTPKTDATAKDTVYLMAVQTAIYDPKLSTASGLVPVKILEDDKRENCCRMGIRVKATQNTKDMLESFSVLIAGLASTWNGTAWTTTKTPTRNLAAWAREIMTSDKHKPSQYQPEELDAQSWGEWFEYCEAQGFHADGVINRGVRKETLVSTLCRNGNAALAYNPMTGKIEVALDNGRDYSVALLNSDTIQTISTQKELKRRTTGKKVTYVNRNADYEIDDIVFMADGGDYDPETDTLSTANLDYMTDYDHAYKYVWRQMAEEQAQPRTMTVRVGPEAAYYPLFSRVEVQHRSLKKGLAHVEIKSLAWNLQKLQNITLTAPVEVPAGTDCGMIIGCISDSGHGVRAVKVAGSGKTDTLQVLTDIYMSDTIRPSAGNFASFGTLDERGEFTRVTSSMKIINAEETDSGYTLTLVDYNPALYDYGTLPAYKSNITDIPDSRSLTVEDQREYMTEGDAEAIAAQSAQNAVNYLSKGLSYSNRYKLKPVEFTLEDVIRRLDDDARNASASISMSAGEILLQVEGLDKQQRAFIALTKDQILEQVDDMAQSLTGLISVQAGAVQAIVEGGGTSGQLNLSLSLPATITDATRTLLVSRTSETAVNAVYSRVAGTDYYGMKTNAPETALKTLWQAAVNAGLLASQIDLSATQVNIAAENIKITSGADANKLMIENGKIRAALIDVATILGDNAYFTGEIRSAETHLRNDIWTPIIEYWQEYNSNNMVTIDLLNETGAQVRAKLDAIIDNVQRAYKRIDFGNPTNKKVYLYIYSADPEKPAIAQNGIKSLWYLSRLTSDGVTYYSIGNGAIVRNILRNETKVSSLSGYSNLLTFGAYARRMQVSANIGFFDNFISSGAGYEYNEPDWIGGSIAEYNTTQATIFKMLECIDVSRSRPRGCVVHINDGNYWPAVAIRYNGTSYKIFYGTTVVTINKDNTTNTNILQLLV